MIIVPPQLRGKEVKVVPIKHPVSGLECDFVVDDQLWQVLTLRDANEFHAVLLETEASPTGGLKVEDPNFSVLVPVNPLFILLPTLRAAPGLPLEAILQIASGDFCLLPESMAKNALQGVCEDVETPVLDEAKLEAYLLELISRVPVPKSMKVPEVTPEFEPLYQKFVGLNIMSSWLEPDLRDRLEELLELKPLEEHITAAIKERDQANAVFVMNNNPNQGKRQAKAPAKAPAAKKPLNNRSLLDMFAKKPKPKAKPSAPPS